MKLIIKAGFSLIELLVTMLVLATLAAFIVPTYQLILSQMQLNSAAEQVTDFLRLAEQKTVTEQLIYGVTLTNDAVTIPMLLVSGNNRTTVKTLSLPTNMELTDMDFGGATEVRFSTAGAPSVAGSFSVHDTIRDRSIAVEIRPSGNIRNQSEATPTPTPTVSPTINPMGT